MHRGADDDGHGLHCELAGQAACPQIERLLDCRDIRDRRFQVVARAQAQSDLSEMQAMRILAQPVEQFLLSLGAGVITNLPAVSVKLAEAQRMSIKSGRQRRCMPAPLRHRAQRHRVFVIERKRLQAGDVGGEGELAVAER